VNDAGARDKGAKVWLPPPLTYLLCTLAGWAIDRWVWRLPNVDTAPPRIAAALAIGAAGIALLLSTLGLFRRSGQDPRPWTPSPEIIGQGPYRFSRNPMYVGMLLAQVSLGLALDRLWVVLLSPVALAVVHFTAVLPEERYLASRFGSAYEEYTRRVRRYV
jgi:protein-S-isoprenylcysteine O-methyltransferase Ste14